MREDRRRSIYFIADINKCVPPIVEKPYAPRVTHEFLGVETSVCLHVGALGGIASLNSVTALGLTLHLPLHMQLSCDTRLVICTWALRDGVALVYLE